MLHGVPPNPRSPEEMEKRINRLEAENQELRGLQHLSFYKVPVEVFSKATGFRNANEARLECQSSGCRKELEAVSRHHHDADPVLLSEMAGILSDFMPGVADEVQLALSDCVSTISKPRVVKAPQGRVPIVDVDHFFLIPFLYIMGGFYEWSAPILPGIGVSQEHFSRLFSLSLPIIVGKWVPIYYCDRSMDWLRTWCAGNTEERNRGIDCVLYYDGSKHGVERSQGLHEQRHTYNSYVKDNILQFIGLTNSNGWFIDSSTFAGGKMHESAMVWTMGIWDRLNNDAGALGKVFFIKVIVDRGFRDTRDFVEENQGTLQWPWPHLKLEVELVEHLGTKAEPDRTQHPVEEVHLNRNIQARRWVNEKAFAYFNIAHFFDRVIRASTIPMIDMIKVVALGMANKKMEIATPESDEIRQRSK